MKKIRYIGKKPSKTDNVAGTGIMWPKPGAVRDVPDNSADKLLLHPDVWEDAGAVTATTMNVAYPPESDQGEGKDSETNPDEGAEKDAGTDEGSTDEGGEGQDSETQGEENQVSDLAPLVDINAMNSDKLRDYAQRQFGHNFHHNLKDEEKMRQTIVGLMNRG